MQTFQAVKRIANYADGYLGALAMPIPVFEKLISGFKEAIEKTADASTEAPAAE